VNEAEAEVEEEEEEHNQGKSSPRILTGVRVPRMIAPCFRIGWYEPLTPCQWQLLGAER
jgi:hypothetical protein